MRKAKVVAVSLSEEKGKKRNYPYVELKRNYGIRGDFHAGNWHRQVSLLALESIEKMRQKGIDVKPGDFAENITTSGIQLSKLKIGMRLKIGKDVVLEISQLGKECHSPCAIYYQVGDCVMPKEGIFARVVKGGMIKPGDEIVIIAS